MKLPGTTSLQNTTTIEETTSNDNNATESSYSTNRLPLGLSRSVSSEYIQDSTTQTLKNQFLILNDELYNVIETDTIDLQTPEDSSSHFLHDCSSIDKWEISFDCSESPVTQTIEDASDNFSIVDSDSSYTDMTRHQWKSPVNPTSSRDDNGYIQCSLTGALEPEMNIDNSSNPTKESQNY